MLTREDHKTYEQILREELTPAFGCTEPIALAYCAAKAREVLGQMPTEVIIEASGNIIKECKECYRTEYRWHEGNPGGSGSWNRGRRFKSMS